MYIARYIYIYKIKNPLGIYYVVTCISQSCLELWVI